MPIKVPEELAIRLEKRNKLRGASKSAVIRDVILDTATTEDE